MLSGSLLQNDPPGILPLYHYRAISIPSRNRLESPEEVGQMASPTCKTGQAIRPLHRMRSVASQRGMRFAPFTSGPKKPSSTILIPAICTLCYNGVGYFMVTSPDSILLPYKSTDFLVKFFQNDTILFSLNQLIINRKAICTTP